MRTFAADPEALGGFSAWDYSVDAGATWTGPVDAATVCSVASARPVFVGSWAAFGPFGVGPGVAGSGPVTSGWQHFAPPCRCRVVVL